MTTKAPERTTKTRERQHRSARRKRSRWNWTLFLLFAGPNIGLILMFIYYPLIANIRFSTLNWRLGSDSAQYIGFDNFVRFFTSDTGVEVWRVTGIFTIATVIGSMVLGLLLAVVLNRKLPGRTVVRTAVFSPYVLSGVGVGLVWSFIFDPNLGVLGHVFRFFGQRSPEWFLDPDLALVMVIVVYIWKNLGYCAVIFLAGLQSIPDDLLEAASIDRAGSVRRFFKVVLPLLSPTMFFILITSILSSMQAFDVLRIMTPTGHGTNTILFEVYLQSFGAYQRAGYSAAISVVLFLVLFLITAVQIRYVERKVHYA
ncbi:carbohydrate ABC transporter permease [uncultured Agrococcus sp.]|uniref:carbohydrate ABC transporter permease n=1 Tax=uncultured Agrococcus sp. TaxID=382258 RepID=UPI0025FD353B|nr:sugar ABC transporter permease [uncultured Agrococcus sp.]